MCLSVCFLIIPRAPSITGMVVVLSCLIFSDSISRFLYLLILLYSLIFYHLLALSYLLEDMFFFYTPYLLLIFLSVWIAKFQRKLFPLLLLLVLVGVYTISTIQYSTVFIYFPMNVTFSLIMVFFIFY